MQFQPPNFDLRRQANIRRVHIVGGSGSGKTTLAGRLAIQLKTTAYDLDEVGYEGGAGPKRSLALRLADVRSITAQASWVSEGIFLWWIDELVQAADIVVWLDLPWHTVVWRMISRHVKLNRAGTNRHPSWIRLLALLRWNRAYYSARVATEPISPDDDSATSRIATANYLASYQSKVIQCRTAAEVAELSQVFEHVSIEKIK